MSIQQQIKQVLINLAANDQLPLDLHQLDESLFDPVIDPVIDVLETLRTDAEMALDGSWDHTTTEGREGFESQIILIETILQQQP
jgi:hypothetical protein